MGPSFALHFLADEISLDQKRGKAWLTLGTAAFNSGQFACEIQALRAKGEAAARAAGLPFETKLVLPSDQIKVLTLDEATPTEASVARALEGATPYAVSELRFDWRSEGTVTRIAAVAQETLDEAASFASEHGLGPVAFVAFPGEDWADVEAFFGVVASAEAARDPEPYVRWEDGAEIIDASQETSTEAAGDETSEQNDPASAGDEGSLEDARPTAEDEDPNAALLVLTQDAAPQAAFQTRRKLETPEVAPEAEAEPAKLSKTVEPAVAPIPDRKVPPLSRGPEATLHRPNSGTPSIKTPEPSEPVPEPRSLAASLMPNVIAAAGGGAKDIAFQSKRVAESAAPKVAAPAPPTGQPAAAVSDGALRGGKPKFMGLILTVLLIVGLLAVAAIASIREDGLANLWNRVIPSAPDAPVTALAVPEEVISQPDVVNITPAPLAPSPLDPPKEVLPDTIAEEAGEANVPLIQPLSDTELERMYAATGIWSRAPEAPRAPLASDVETVYITSIDRVVSVGDAIALEVASLGVDTPLPPQTLPPAPGAKFRFDENGLLLATPEGAVSPLGYTVIAGRPPVEPPLRVPEGAEILPDTDRLASFRPRPRPETLAEDYERLAYGGLTRDELAVFRPKLRPESAKALEENDAKTSSPSENAVASSLRPESRPQNIDTIIARARAAQPAPTAETTTVAAAAPAPTIRSSGPTRATVARAATTENVIRLRRVNLIGVYGTPSNRSALVRLANGRFVKVQVGGRLDGGRVSAISESSLRYQKSGRNITLEIPS